MRARRWMRVLLAGAISLAVVSTACEARVDGDGGEIEIDGEGGK